MELTANLHAFLWSSTTTNNCNTYLLRSEKKTILVDPGHASCFDHVGRGLEGLGLSRGDIDLVIATHAHPDHLEAIQLFDRDTTLFALHEQDWNLVKEMLPLLGGASSMSLDRLQPDMLLREGSLTVGDIDLEVYHTPGHSPGSITLYWPAEKALVAGDLIFRGGLGRTDIPGGNSDHLKDSIRRMAGIEAGWLLPGHGEIVSGADAVKANFRQVENMWFQYL